MELLYNFVYFEFALVKSQDFISFLPSISPPFLCNKNVEKTSWNGVIE